MDATDDKVNLTGNILTESSRPIRLGDAMISRPHICGFFNSHDDEYRVLLPFIKDGLECGEKTVHIGGILQENPFLCVSRRILARAAGTADPVMRILGRRS